MKKPTYLSPGDLMQHSSRIDFEPYILIATGGFIGAVCRYLIDIQGGSLEGTLMANSIGCFCLGAFMSSVTYLGMFTRVHRLFLVSGVIGSFTTFSTTMVQTFQSGPAFGCLYLGANLFFGISGIYLGRFCIMYRRIS